MKGFVYFSCKLCLLYAEIGQIEADDSIPLASTYQRINKLITTTPPQSKILLPPLLKMREVTKLLSLSPGSVRALIDSGDLDAKALNPTTKRRAKRVHVRITQQSLLNFYQKRFGQALPRNL